MDLQELAAGMQRYAWNWTGDIESSWEALAITIPSIRIITIRSCF
jgi:alpha-glucosidase (family GH31 glycosyl hydrolase)